MKSREQGVMNVVARSLAAVSLTLLIALPAPAAQSVASATATRTTEHSDEAYVIEQSRTTWRYEDDGSGRRQQFLRVRVQSEAGVKNWGQLVFPYNASNERMDVVVVRVLKADGTVVTATADAIQDLSSAIQREAPVYTDTREKHITVPGLRPGEVLEVSLVTDVHTPLAPGHFWGDYDVYRWGVVLDERFQIDVPAGKKITLKTRPGFEPTVTDRDGRRIYDWKTSRSAPENGERESLKNPFKPETPAIRLTTFQTWSELGRWYHELESTPRAPNAEIRKKASELTDGRPTALEKFDALYEYVATNFRYVSLSFGTGRYKPHAAFEVLRNQYGDCKVKHTLLASLAESIGLHASAVLINSSSNLDAEFPSPAQFDHVITRATVGAEDVWADATAEVAPFRLLSPQLRGKRALVVSDEGLATVAETPTTTPMKNGTAAVVDGRLTDSGSLTADVVLTFSGDFELLMRTMFRRTPSNQWKSMVEKIADQGDLGSEIADLSVSNPVALHEPFTVQFRTANPNFAASSKKAIDVELPLAEFVSAPPRTFGDDADSAIELGPEREIRYTLRLAMPESYTGQPPLRFSSDRDYASYRADYTFDHHVFVAERTLTVRQRELARSRTDDYAAFRRAVAADLRQTLALENRAPTSVGAPKSLTVQELYNSGTDAVDASRFEQARTLLERAVELEPTHRKAWTNLGRAYMGLHRTEDAITAFRKQIAINPYDQWAYNNLGYAFRSQQKFADAEAAFKKQLEVDPLNPFAHESLGGIYLQQRQYERAVPEIENAISVSPKNGPLRVRLGEALINLRKVDDARAAFSRAVELDPSPGTWNDVAYQLALSRTDLDIAKRYAESAIATVTAASRTASAARVTARDLGSTNALGLYWDTLGWIYFVQGDFERAEPFVRAAWQLTQNAEIGDHLGQLYEKLGRRDDAIRAYALSMNAEGSDQRSRDRLVGLVGSAERADLLARQHAPLLENERAIRLDVTGATPATADFVVALDNTQGNALVAEVVFVSGDDALKPMADGLRRAVFGVAFPDSAPSRILRRGTVSCGTAASSCRFIMMLPDRAQATQPQ